MHTKTKIKTFHKAYKCRHVSSRLFFILCLLCAINVALPSVGLAANSLSQFGITWTFDRDYTVGQFANGDWWVLDEGSGVNVISISPGAGIYNGYDVHGSEKNPVAGEMIQGYDEQFGRYNVLKNVGLNLPITLYATDSIVSSISNTPPARHIYGGQYTVMKTAAVLTCLGAVPPEGTFRPSYTDRTHATLYNRNQLDWSLLASLPASGAPPISDVERSFERVWLDHWPGWSGQHYRPLDNMDNYGREIASTAGIGALMLHTNLSQAQKETLLIRYVQLGIDLYGILKNGGDRNWPPDGGHASGRKWPIIFAGLMLDDTGMKGIGTDGSDYYFGMDMQTFYVSQADVDLANGPTWNPDERSGTPFPYTVDMIGMPEWGIRYSTAPEQSDAAWYAIYRQCCTARAWQGHILSALIMGAKNLWNHDALFDYMDRYMAITNGDSDPFGYTVPGETAGWRSFNGWVVDMWDIYRPLLDESDNTPPLPPTNLISTAQTENSISLSWTAPGPASDGDLASSYRIFRDTSLVGWGVESSFQDTGLAADTSYSYEVYSVDDAGNQSTSAATGTFSTLADTTPPVISSVQTSNVTASQATITWNTDEASTSQVEYGLNTNYGNSTSLNANLVTSHSVLLTGLASETLYHYRVKSKDASGNESISQDNTFTTSGASTYSIIASVGNGGQISPSGTTLVASGGSQTYTITATAGYDISDVVVDGSSVGAVSSYPFTNVTDNHTIAATFDEQDVTAPIVTNLSPQADSIQASLNILVTLSITDSGDGVDANSVTIKVNNDTVYTGNTDKYSSAYGKCYRTGTNANYRFIYQSEQNFDFDQSITVTVNAQDLAGNSMAGYSYSFKTEMRSFGENKKVSSDTLSKGRPVTMRDSSGNIWAVWHAGPAGNRDIYIGKLATGADNFGDSHQVPDSNNDNIDECNPVIAVGSDDKLYVAWQDNRRGNWDIYVSTSSDGINFSTETRVTDSNDNQINPAIVVDSSLPNNAYIVWEDDRHGNSNKDIYIATSSDGFVTKTIAQITSDSSNQVEPAIAADSANTIYVVWTDTRNSKNDIYGAASNNSWTNIPVVTTGDSQSSPAIATEAVGSILHLVWVDDTPGDDDIFYAKTSGGLPSSPLTGSSIIDDTSGTDQLRPAIAVSGSTGNNLQVFVCWEDERNADEDLYFTELGSGSGTNVFVDDDGTNTNQTEPAMNIDGDGHPYLVWTDSRNTNTDIYYAGSTFIESDLLASNNISTSSTVIVGTPLNAIDSVDDVSVVVPAGAYPCDLKITISKITNPLGFGMPCLGAYDFGPSGIEFSQPVTVTIPYNFTGSEDSALAYWYNSLTDALSQQGITDVETIAVPSSSNLHALRFKTTHFTPFYVFLVSAGGAAASGGGGGGGGCSMSPDSQASIVELLLPYMGLTVTMVILKLRDRRKKKALNITKSEC